MSVTYTYVFCTTNEALGRHIRVDTPFPVDSKQEFLTFTYLDTTGHPTITLEKKNVVDEFVGPILVTYQYDPIRLYQKPLAVAVALFAVFIALSIYMNIDLSIVKVRIIEYGLGILC